MIDLVSDLHELSALFAAHGIEFGIIYIDLEWDSQLWVPGTYDDQTYFENTPYWGLRPNEVVEVTGIETSKRGDGIYVVSAQFTEVARQGIPEWTVFQEFFFSLEDSIWKVFAIS